jgi:hypothetical protein
VNGDDPDYEALKDRWERARPRTYTPAEFQRLLERRCPASARSAQLMTWSPASTITGMRSINGSNHASNGARRVLPTRTQPTIGAGSPRADM